jgi:hypothetical protein
MFLFFLCLWNDLPPNGIKIISDITDDEEQIPLTSMDITAKAYGTTASVDFVLKYKNIKNDTLVETRLVFPMDDDMALSDAVLRYDDKVFISEVMRKQEARRAYEEQKRENHTALLVSKSEDHLSIDLCSLPPEKEISISFTLYANLPVYFDSLKEKFAVRFVLPTTFFPRYSLRSPQEEVNEDSIALEPKIGQPKYDFQITFENHMDGEMECITKDAVVDQEKGTININTIPKNDFIVNIYIPDHPKTQYEIDGEHRVVNFKVNPVTFYQNEKESPPKSIVFLLDCSGSMRYEDRMSNVKKSMDLFIHSLPANSMFEIVRFGSNYDSLFNTLKEYNDNTIKEALDFIRETDATMGGTEMLNPIRHIITNYKPDIIFLLTDGEVSNSGELTDYVKDFPTKIYALGVGAGADINLVRNLARFTSGTHEHIVSSNKIESAVIRLLGDAISPFITQMKLQTNCGALMQLAPRTIGRNSILDLYYYGTLNESSSKFCQLTISGERNGEDITFDLNSSDGYQLHNSKHLFATAVVRATNDDAIDPDLGFEIAHKYRILTKKTSLILYDNETKHDTNFSETVYVPVSQYGGTPSTIYDIYDDDELECAIVSGYDREAEPFMGSIILGNYMRPDPVIENSQSIDVAIINNTEHFSEEMAKADADDDETANADKDGEIRKAAEVLKFEGVPCIGANYCKELTRAQSASGEWEDIESIIRAITGKTESSKPLLSAIAIIYLEKECSSSHGLLSQKAKKFLISKYGKEEVKKLISKAEGYFTN